jgi:hypothetical protein
MEPPPQMILSDDEIIALTQVRCRKRQERWKRQRATLVAMGIEHKVRPDGSLVVSRSHVEKVLGGEVKTAAEQDYEVRM